MRNSGAPFSQRDSVWFWVLAVKLANSSSSSRDDTENWERDLVTNFTKYMQSHC
jgi:hypothetical protein